ncbi:MerR family transcriptional regulator [Methylocaldum szegediense]|jgi:hypothetical protein|uniref:Helix-turn-helix domain-containing protein n=1 Tax=Methylocaldum szegediense TaxID=73780 RepID=A0ABN8WXV6_9GAMM|nr:helix-turn-helix domain-containing protein [Methylocaldum szegediense]CAI8749249.1 protein of unknown function [Methylocaldum szegediense]
MATSSTAESSTVHDRVISKRVTPSKSRVELAREFAESHPDALVTTAQVAAWMDCSEAKLERDRWAGVGIPYIKHGRHVRYVKRVVVEHVLRESRASTSADPA